MARRFDVIHACVSEDARARASVSARLERAGRKVVHVDAALLEERLDGIEVLVCGEAPRIDWSRAQRLRLLQLMGSGIETLWPATGLPPQAEIANARGIHLPEMRDHVLALLFAFERELARALAQNRERHWSPFPAGSLQGKTVAVLGLGEVGRSVAAACSGLGMRVIGTCAQPRPTPHVDEVHGPDGLDHVLGAADYVVVLLPLTARTRGLIDGRALSKMHPKSVLLHVSRGGIVDEAALSKALCEGRLRGAALDVFEREPLPREDPLWTVPNLIVTPHLAGLMRGYFGRVLALLIENLECIERGLSCKTRVDRDRGY